MKQSNTFKRLGTGVVLTAFLVCCFFGATFTLHPNYAWAEAPGPCLNGGNAVINTETENKFLEPGMTLKKPFYIKSSSETEEVQYFLYFDIKNMSNPLVKEFAETVQVCIKDTAGNEIASGSMADLQKPTEKKSDESYDVLKGKKDLILQIHYPGDAGNTGQLQSLDFDMHLAFLIPENNEG